MTVMPKIQDKNPDDYIVPLNMNGLQGRMVQLPGKKQNSREILVIYGHHALLERWWGLIENFNDFGAVTMPDLPGFGGMDSFYKIGTKPTIDAYADYLAAFIKLKYKRRRLTIFGISFGFVIVTRMLERYPDLAKKVDVLASAVGFAHSDDFIFSRPRMTLYRIATKLVSLPVVSNIFRVVCLNPLTLRLAYSHTHNAKHKFAETADSQEKFDKMMDLEIRLWHENDIRTHMYTCNQFLHLDNCRAQVDLPLWHAYSANDHYFNNDLVEQHMRVIFSDFHAIEIQMKTHAPSILADKVESAALIPDELRQLLG